MSRFIALKSIVEAVETQMLLTECVTDLDYRGEMVIFGSILTFFELSSIFGGSWGSIENWL